MGDQETLINKFYNAFQNKDWQTMQSCYHNEIQFSDPVFPDLTGKKAKAMWHMLVEASTGLVLSFNQIKSDQSERATCQWEAIYDFSKTGRKVHNVIQANFVFKEGLIISHRDHFDLWKWSRMALGLTGTLLGWTPFLKRKIQKMANGNLASFIKKHPEYQ